MDEDDGLTIDYWAARATVVPPGLNGTERGIIHIPYSRTSLHMGANYFSRFRNMKGYQGREARCFFALANLNRSSLKLRLPDNYGIASFRERELLCICNGVVSLVLGPSRRQNSHNEAQTPRK